MVHVLWQWIEYYDLLSMCHNNNYHLKALHRNKAYYNKWTGWGWMRFYRICPRSMHDNVVCVIFCACIIVCPKAHTYFQSKCNYIIIVAIRIYIETLKNKKCKTAHYHLIHFSLVDLHTYYLTQIKTKAYTHVNRGLLIKRQHLLLDIVCE